MIIVAAVVMAVVIFIVCLWQHNFMQSYGSAVGGLVICMISIANAILLYLTLTQQQNEQENQGQCFKQERFEITFFNLLSRHEQITNQISYSKSVYELKDQTMQTYTGRNYFKYTNNRLDLINASLDSKKYIDEELSTYVEAHIEKLKEEIGMIPFGASYDSKIEDEIRKNKRICDIDSVNREFGITKEIWNQCQQLSEEEKRIRSIQILDNKMHGVYEHYLRSLLCIKDYIEDYDQDKCMYVKYWKFVTTQMDDSEQKFIAEYALIDNRYEMYKKINNRL